ncbi:MAG TPA: bifunctional adenosylcobinamide kinase/adenosylcobinamide-phosphate guanylyltransferase [Acidimicrobiia bacterium]|nr:bifunctional adenosylcobinamide kinase/adenosylcobinamide-phosphate guanylyltransferase [Acidimicrobiia bacterium]
MEPTSSLTLLVGGARSGKSKLGAAMVEGWDGPAGVIATAEALDQEMVERIEHHRRSRPSDWLVVEEPIDLEGALAGFDSGTAVLIDCLTLWVSNLMGQQLDPPDVERRASAAAAVAAARPALTVVVSNEVGSGIVPMNAMARQYRDLLGKVNAIWADAAGRVLLTVAGGVIPVSRIGETSDRNWDG